MTSETVEAVEAALGRFAVARSPARHVLLAVSGGPDSLALLLALADRSGDLAVSVATVDHGLRPEASGEAAHVAALCRDLGLPHRTLAWKPPRPLSGNLMAAAREARYRLLAEEAVRVGADALLAAHHADDQIETHLLARGRGASGSALAGMRPWRDLEPGLVLVRPFLDLRKRALAAAVARAGLAPVADPSNDDARFHRVRLRADLASGVHDAAAIRQAIAEADTLRKAADTMASAAIRRMCDEGRLAVDDGGGARLRPIGEEAVPWSRLLTGVGGALHPPARESADRLAARLKSDGGIATLAGCRVEATADELVIARDYGREGPPGVPVGDVGPVAFDRRFTIVPPLPEGAARVEPFGRLGLGNARHRTLPVALDEDGRLLAVHPALGKRFPTLPVLATHQRVGWRVWADLPGDAPDRLTAQPQNAANPREAVGKDLAATYLRGRVKVRAP